METGTFSEETNNGLKFSNEVLSRLSNELAAVSTKNPYDNLESLEEYLKKLTLFNVCQNYN